MPSLYDHYELRMESCGPVAAESPFDSGTLWGRIIHALSIGDAGERELARQWITEFNTHIESPDTPFAHPLVISEGFACDAAGEPWLPLPLATTLALQKMPEHQRGVSRKDIKRLSPVPRSLFLRICSGERPDGREWQSLLETDQKPHTASGLTPHLGMDRLTGTGRNNMLYITAVNLYQPATPARRKQTNAQGPEKEFSKSRLPAEIVFYLKLRQKDRARDLVRQAVDRICLQGWGHGASRGLGRIQCKGFDPSPAPPEVSDAEGFVSLSHFTPSKHDPTEGQWKLKAKHPVPAPFLDGKRIILGEEDSWRVRSFLRLVAGSCLLLRRGETLQEFYGSILSHLLDKPEDHEGNPLPPLFHYALSYPWPLKQMSVGG